MLVKIFGSAIHGVSAQTITIEVNVDTGGVGYHLVGLPDNAIKESSYRINAALKNVGYKIPGKKITINMAPADLRKEGSAYDLSIAIGILAASDLIKAENLEFTRFILPPLSRRFILCFLLFICVFDVADFKSITKTNQNLNQKLRFFHFKKILTFTFIKNE